MKKLKIPRIQSQRDGRWTNVLLGYNTNQPYTIGNYGCLITCFANYLDKTPIEINDILKANQGFIQGGLFVWSKSTVLGLNQVYLSPRYEDAVSSQGLDKMRQLIDEGRPLIAEIDFNPSTVSEEMHYVLIHGYDGNDKFFCIDPWTGQEIDLDVYGGVRRAVYQFRAYDKTLPFQADENYYKGLDLNNKESMKAAVDIWHEVMIDKKWVNREEYNQLKSENEKLKIEVSGIGSLQAEKNSLAVQLQECQRQSAIYKVEYDNAIKDDGYIAQINHLKEAKEKQQEEITELTRQVGYWQAKFKNLRKSGLKFIQAAIIEIAEKLGVDLTKIS